MLHKCHNGSCSTDPQGDFFCLPYQGFAKILSTSFKGVWRIGRQVWSGAGMAGLEMAAQAAS